MAEDYPSVSVLRSVGFLERQVQSYAQWSGRFAFMLSINVAETIGSSVVRLLPALAILGLSASLGHALTAAFLRIGIRHPVRAAAFVAVYELLKPGPFG